jgi:hypothetical protein
MATKRQISKLAKAVAEVGDRTGNFLERTDPGKATRALEMLADGESFRTIQKELGLQWDTVARLKARHKTLLDERRAVLAEDALEIAEGLRLLQKEKMRMLAEDPEQLARTNIRDLSIPWGISVDKYLAVLGENKVTVEHKSAAPSLEDAMAAIQAAKDKLRLASINVDSLTVEPKPVEQPKD